jgi:hypothetical protein
MAAKSKEELLAVTLKEFTKLNRVLDGLSEDAALRKRDDDTSLKDVVGHRAHWISLFMGWYADGLAGKDVYFPAEGYKWNQLKDYNRQLRGQQEQLGWADARALLQANHLKLVAFMEGHAESELYGGPMKGANNAWTPGRWAEAAGPSHYRSAAKYARQCVREDGG